MAMTNIMLSYNMGCSGGSFVADAINTYPGAHVLEEPRRKLGYHPVPEGWTPGDIQAVVFKYLREQYESGKWSVVGYIKGFRPPIEGWAVARGARLFQQFRNPIKVLYGTRKRKLQPTRWWGREPVNEREYFEGHVCWMACRYLKYLSRVDRVRLVRLEDLSASLITPEAEYFRDVMEYATQLPWDLEAVERVRTMAAPRHRPNAKGADKWREGYTDPAFTKKEWPELVDPTPEVVWNHWHDWQREIFLREFGEIMGRAGYEIPEVTE